MRIALDAMGSDDCPVPDVEGAVLAAREYGDHIFLVGDEPRIREQLARHDTTGLRLEVIHTPEYISMTDKPGDVGKAKPNSSMHVGMNLIRDGKADAFVTAGNTGAALAIATLFTLKRIPGIKRPALTALIRIAGQSIIALDVGANADSKPEWLVQFALMGTLYARATLGLPNARVALLSNGEEDEKGNEVIREAHHLLKQSSLNFVGNVEPKDMLKGHVDVIVADGFVGNIMLKSLEGATSMMVTLLRQELMRTPVTKLGAALARPAFRRIQKQIDPSEVGGAPLLGVNGVVIIGHGRSNATAIKNAIGQARKAVEGNLIESIRSGLESMSPETSA
ncbi:phosphate acyltransferase PlsX [Kamptonema cortianum]|jgi:glycerol-3-phosphate acyltransferase PlsX|nr:phosphate acyltransferase PlsX [Kamptonema cortianum]